MNNKDCMKMHFVKKVQYVTLVISKIEEWYAGQITYYVHNFIRKEGSFYSNEFLMRKLSTNMIFGMSWIILMTEEKKWGSEGNVPAEN